jgi:hypothetical protein
MTLRSETRLAAAAAAAASLMTLRRIETCSCSRFRSSSVGKAGR